MSRPPAPRAATHAVHPGRWPRFEEAGARVAKRPSPGPSVPRTLAINAVTGAIVGLVVLALLLALDPLGLWPLLARDEHGLLLLVMMALQFSAGFAAFAAATGLFLLDREPDAR